MPDSRWDRLEALYAEGLNVPQDQLGPWVDEKCAGDAELRAELASLLEAARESPDFLDRLSDEVLAPAVQGLLGTEVDSTALSDPLIGATVGPYRIDAPIGQGGMGVVYSAVDTRLDRTVALKFMVDALSRDEDAARRFMREAKAASALDHSNICTIYDVGETEDGRMYLAMALYEGETLAARLLRGPLPLPDAAGIVTQCARALAAAHARGIVHRDIKPANIFITRDGTVKLLDFGIATMADATRTGALVAGTVSYMSPEQAQGQDVDARTDVWALGAIYYEILTGQRPFTGEHPQAVIYSILNSDPVPLTELREDVPAAVDALIRRALDKDRGARYRDGGALLVPLGDAARASGAMHIRPERTRSGLRGRWRAGVSAVGAALAVVMIGLFWPDQPARAGDGRIGVAIYPFRPTSEAGQGWAEQIPDLLATILDGTPGVRIGDPWTLWHTLRDEPGALARSPGDLDEASRLADAQGFSHFVTGTVTENGGTIQTTLRIYATGSDEADRTALFEKTRDSVGHLVQEMAVATISAVFPGSDRPTVPGISRFGTNSAIALKSYLLARESMRRGHVLEAETAIDQALEADTAFGLALSDAIVIKSWAVAMQGRPYLGLPQLAQRTVAFGDSLNERNRLRGVAMVAAVATRGADAVAATNRILEIDSTDIAAWSSLGYFHTAYGWQYGADHTDALDVMRRALALDPTNVPNLVQHSWLNVATGDRDAMQADLDALLAVDTTNSLTRSTMVALRAILVDEDDYPAVMERIAASPDNEWTNSLRYLRTGDPDRAVALLDYLIAANIPGKTVAAIPARARFWIGQGRLRQVHEAIEAGAFEGGGFTLIMRTFMVAAGIADPSVSAIAQHHVEWFTRAMPSDSVLAMSDRLGTWWYAWLLGAYHATNGEIAEARAWQESIMTLPGGGGIPTYREGLWFDIEARIATRNNQLDLALQSADSAFIYWSDHGDRDLGSRPPPAIRFLRGRLFLAAGQPDSAAAMFQSLVPPTTWTGTYTPRAAYELGLLREAAGQRDEAIRHFTTAALLWKEGGEEMADWFALVQAGLERVERGN